MFHFLTRGFKWPHLELPLKCQPFTSSSNLINLYCGATMTVPRAFLVCQVWVCQCRSMCRGTGRLFPAATSGFQSAELLCSTALTVEVLRFWDVGLGIGACCLPRSIRSIITSPKHRCQCAFRSWRGHDPAERSLAERATKRQGLNARQCRT